MFGLRVLLGPDAEVPLARISVLGTGPISLAFLEWARRGQTLAPVHDLLAAVVGGDCERAARSARALAGVGATSGADFAQGFRSILSATAVTHWRRVLS
jgi:hypothetical protein